MPTWANTWDTGVKFWKLSTGEWASQKFKTIELHNNWKLPKIPKWGGTYCFSMFPHKLQLGRKYHTPCSNPLVKKEQDHKFRKLCQLQSFSSTLIPGRSWRGGGLRLSPKKNLLEVSQGFEVHRFVFGKGLNWYPLYIYIIIYIYTCILLYIYMPQILTFPQNSFSHITSIWWAWAKRNCSWNLGFQIVVSCEGLVAGGGREPFLQEFLDVVKYAYALRYNIYIYTLVEHVSIYFSEISSMCCYPLQGDLSADHDSQTSNWDGDV